MFHQIIDNNRRPDPDAKYIFVDDTMWLGSQRVTLSRNDPTCIIAREVRRNHDRSLSFKTNLMEGTFRSIYGWAFVLNTPENVAAYLETWELDKQITKLKAELLEKRNNVLDLQRRRKTNVYYNPEPK